MHKGRASMPRLILLSMLACIWFGDCTTARAAEAFTFQHENVLGTSCEIKVWTDTREQAQRVERSVLAEIDRLKEIFSSYDQQSDLMRWQRGELSGKPLPSELVTVLRRAEFWRAASGGAFDVRAGELGKLWQAAAEQQREPDPRELKRLCDSLHDVPYVVEASGIVVKRDACMITLDALAKGFILDAACLRARAEHTALAGEGPDGLSVMIGGDIRIIGAAAEPVALANPFDAGEGSRPVATVKLQGSKGLATSGGYRRYYELNGARRSHILDPRSGQSAAMVAAATVIAPSGMDADAAATTLCVLGPTDGMNLLEGLEGYAALIVLNSGEVLTSSRWAQYQLTPSSSRPLYVHTLTTADDKDKGGLFVKFTLGSEKGGRYLRPYVAVWLEDKDGFPVKTAVLWLQTTAPGPRWHRDLTKWYGNDQMRKLVDQKELIGTISGATRGAGEYETRFDGTDNDGQPLKPGKYSLCLEAAREHGTHQYVKETFEWSDKPIAKTELKAGTEFRAISYRFTPGPVPAEPAKAR